MTYEIILLKEAFVNDKNKTKKETYDTNKKQ